MNSYRSILTCNKGGFHDGEVIYKICLETACKLDCLVCPVCREKQHSTHNLISLKDFYEQVEWKYQVHAFKNAKKPSSKSTQIEEIVRSCQSEFRSFKDILEQKLSHLQHFLENGLKEQLNKLRETEIRKSENQMQNVVSKLRVEQDVNVLRQSISFILQNSEFKGGKLNNIESLQESLNKSSGNQTSVQGLEGFVSDFTQCLKKINNFVQQETLKYEQQETLKYEPTPAVRFDSPLKHQQPMPQQSTASFFVIPLENYNRNTLTQSNFFNKNSALAQTTKSKQTKTNHFFSIEPENKRPYSKKSLEITEPSEYEPIYLKFTKRGMHAALQLSDDNLETWGTTEQLIPKIAILDPSIETGPKHKIVRFAFHIKNCKLVGYSCPMAIGVCFKKFAQGNDFVFAGEDIVENQSFRSRSSAPQNKSYKQSSNDVENRHGCVILTSNGFLRNCCDQREDMKKVNVRFNNGDIIIIEYNPFKNYLQFIRRSSGESVKTFIKSQPFDRIHACARISYQNDQVSFYDLD